MGAQNSTVVPIRPSDAAFGNELTDKGENLFIPEGNKRKDLGDALAERAKLNVENAHAQLQLNRTGSVHDNRSKSKRLQPKMTPVHTMSSGGRSKSKSEGTSRAVLAEVQFSDDRSKSRKRAPKIEPLEPLAGAVAGVVQTSAHPKHQGGDGLKMGALFAAAKSGTIDTISWLLETGANVNAVQRPHGATALYAAAQNGHLKAVKLLLQLGADPNIKRIDDGGTALHAVAELGLASIMKALVHGGADVNSLNRWNATPLLAATVHAPDGTVLPCVETLLEANADPSLADSTGKFPLAVAAAVGRLEVVKAICRTDIDVNQVDNDGSSSLYAACYFGHRQVVRALISYQADVNLATNTGATPLFVAAQNGSYGSCEALLEVRKIRTNATNQEGRTALHAACQTKQAAIVNLLVESGCDSRIKGKFGTAMDEMSIYGIDHSIKQLLSKAKNKKSPRRSPRASPRPSPNPSRKLGVWKPIGPG